MWGSDIKTLDVGLPQGHESETIDDGRRLAWFGYGLFIDNLDIVATVIAAMSGGRAGRCSANTPSRAGRFALWRMTIRRHLSVGHFALLHLGAWSGRSPGFVALVAGIMWGAKSGVQFSLSLIALEGVAGADAGRVHVDPRCAIVGGLIIGVGEKLFEFFDGTDDRRRDRKLVRLCACADLFLVFRPQGLFGEKIIERV